MKKILLIFAAIAALMSCSSSDDNNSDIPKDITLTYGDSISYGNVSYNDIDSENDFIALPKKNGYILAFHVGQTKVKIGNQYSTITVNYKTKPQYKEPITEWGVSKDYIKSNETGILGKESDDVLLYDLSYPEFRGYTFKNGQLKASAVELLASSVSAKDLANTLSEKYLPIKSDPQNFSYYFVDALENEKANTYVVLSITTVSYQVVYQIFYGNYSEIRSSRSMSKESIIKDIDRAYPDFNLKK